MTLKRDWLAISGIARIGLSAMLVAWFIYQMAQ
jgi:hypothetical protein